MRKGVFIMLCFVCLYAGVKAQGGFLGYHNSLQTNISNAALNRQFSLSYQHFKGKQRAFAAEVNVSGYTARNLTSAFSTLPYYYHTRRYISIGFSRQSSIVNTGIPNHSVQSFFFDAGTSALSKEDAINPGGELYKGPMIGLRYRYSYSHFFTQHLFGSVGFEYGMYKFLNMPDYFYGDYRTFFATGFESNIFNLKIGNKSISSMILDDLYDFYLMPHVHIGYAF